MSSSLLTAIMTKDTQNVEEAITLLHKQNAWSLITLVDEFLPFLVMETNLRYRNFHLVKMALFLRKLAMEGYFSKSTEYAIIRLLSFEMVHKSWVHIQADWGEQGHVEKIFEIDILQELERHNAHNAFYYATSLLRNDPDKLSQFLLMLGAKYIPDTLGHSVSCFFPVAEDMLSVLHPQTDTALLSFIMYLSRYPVSQKILQEVHHKTTVPEHYGKLLKRCASGSDIINLHHMITLYIFTAWEDATFNQEGRVPYRILLEWVETKQTDKEREEKVSHALSTDTLPQTYEEFRERFSLKELDTSLSLVVTLLENFPKRTIDWLFRVYTTYYDPATWDPHYYTSLYAALRLYLGEKVKDSIACRMALDQAIRYFSEGVNY